MPRQYTPRDPIVCAYCGQLFKTSDWRRKFCTRACAYAQRTRDMAERFWEKVDRSDGPAACWPWMAKMSSKGYGAFETSGRRQQNASRVAWLLTHGSIPDGNDVCHSCDENYPVGDTTYRRCCNPAHLFLGSKEENMADAVRKGRIAHGIRLPQSKLTPEKVVQIRQRANAGEAQRRIAASYGVSYSVVSNVIGRKTWRDVR